MIDLRLKVDPLPISEPLVVRLCDTAHPSPSENDAHLVRRDAGSREYDIWGFSLTVYVSGSEELDGDLLLILPRQPSAHRLIRANSKHNTLLITEQCDQLCVMCSQPPKKHHADLFDEFAIAAKLAPRDAYIGISGGEPMLHKQRLFEFLADVCASRQDLRFHILTNGQHFEASDLGLMDSIGLDRILWGIPLYASRPDIHDQIVGKAGAFAQLKDSLAMLTRLGASVELRTVVMKQNWNDLPQLANFIINQTPFISVWALMQMERIGYGRMNWDKSFQDTSIDFRHLKSAINLAKAKGIPVSMYNFPLCTVPANYRSMAPSTISDWKRKYLDLCQKCSARSTCGGFFEWYSPSEGFVGLGAL